jgi:hypothetical protein
MNSASVLIHSARPEGIYLICTLKMDISHALKFFTRLGACYISKSVNSGATAVKNSAKLTLLI